MTGAYLRVKRDGKWCNVEIDQMTDVELDDLIWKARAQGQDGWVWVRFLAIWIRDKVWEDPSRPTVNIDGDFNDQAPD